MLLLISTFITAFAIEALGTLVSVIGLSLLFGANPIIIALAVALDVNKIINVTLLYSRWKEMGVVMRSYALIATSVTMIITSAGAYSFLSGEFQKAMLGSQEGATQVTILKDQQAKYEARKKQIDDQIARIPDTTSARDRTRIIANFKTEQNDLQKKIGAIDAQLPELQVKQISIEAKTGPIITISKAFNVTPDEAIKWVILMIIFVFDPLAVFDIVAANFLLRLQKTESDKLVADNNINTEPGTAAVIHDVAPAQAIEDSAIHDVMPVEHDPEGSEDLSPAPVEEPASPPVSPEVYPELAPIVIESPPEAPRTENTREVITRDQLHAPAHFSSLNTVKPDDSITFGDVSSKSAEHYRNLN